MSTAVISDIHGNAEALRSVLADIEARGVERVVCLGDIIGYGPEPLVCIDLVEERCEWSLMGTNDLGVLSEPPSSNPMAERAASWTRARLEAETDEAERARRYKFLGQLRVRVVDQERFLAVHGSPRRPINEYIFPEDVISSPVKMQQIFERIEQFCIVGHTHQPGVFREELPFQTPNDLGAKGFPLTNGEKAIINVGSVGQPRDQDPRASYVILSDERAQFVRVEYDIDVTAKKIQETEALNDYLGERLYGGR